MNHQEPGKLTLCSMTGMSFGAFKGPISAVIVRFALVPLCSVDHR